MEHLSSAMEQQQNQVQWRKDKVQQLCSKGYSQRVISQVLQVGLATVNRDLSYLRNQAKTNIKKYIDELLPEEYERCLVGLSRSYLGLFFFFWCMKKFLLEFSNSRFVMSITYDSVDRTCNISTANVAYYSSVSSC